MKIQAEIASIADPFLLKQVLKLLDAAVESDAGASKGEEEADLKQLEEEVLATETNEEKVE